MKEIIMYSEEFIIEHASYKVGYCVKLSNRPIVIDKIYTIVERTTNSSKELNYVLDVKPEDIIKSSSLDGYEQYHYSYVYRDDECKTMERKLKLEKLNENR